MSKRKKIFLVTIGTLLLVVVSFLTRGLIREDGVPAYTTIFYKPSVTKNFDQDFAFVNKRLSAYGFTFKNTDTLLDECDMSGYEGFSESVICEKVHTSDDLHVTNAFYEKWKATSGAFEKELIANGWHKSERDAKQQINKIYDSTEGATVVYTKQHGKTQCELILGNVAFPYGSTTFQRDKEKTYIFEQCDRDIAFFGGY